MTTAPRFEEPVSLAVMRCPNCHAEDTRVIDSRPVDENTAIRRRRSCPECDHRFTTYERPMVVLVVRKRNSRLEAFSAEKLRRGVSSALAGRPVRNDFVDELVETVEFAAMDAAGPIESSRIGQIVLEQLRSVDEVAYLRFASVYKEFQAGADFERELAQMETPAEA